MTDHRGGVLYSEGLPGGKAAIVLKLHHAIADGQGAMRTGAAVVDISPEGLILDRCLRPQRQRHRHPAISPRSWFRQQRVVGQYSRRRSCARRFPLIIALTSPQETVDNIVETVRLACQVHQHADVTTVAGHA